ncbi:hypothetical protein ACQP2K_18355 [Microbispora siamensis]
MPIGYFGDDEEAEITADVRAGPVLSRTTSSGSTMRRRAGWPPAMR